MWCNTVTQTIGEDAQEGEVFLSQVFLGAAERTVDGFHPRAFGERSSPLHSICCNLTTLSTAQAVALDEALCDAGRRRQCSELCLSELLWLACLR
jgi:hypothetical protein